MYLVKSPFGIYHFRFSVRISNRQYQPKLSLRTKCKKEAKYHSAIIAYHISLLTEVTVSSIKAIYSEYKANLSSKTKQAPVINSRASEQVINKPKSLPKDIASVLTDLSTKSKQEYQSCYNSFISKYSEVTKETINSWKQEQSCSESTLKKKLRLLSSVFTKLDLTVEMSWFRLTVKRKLTKRRALTNKELDTVLDTTEEFKDTTDNWKYYLPRMALLTGARLNELAQLRVGDIDLDRMVLSINTNHDDKKLKNASSYRDIPISEKLSKLLQPLVKLKSPELHLFKLTYSQSNGYINKPSKYFSSVFKNMNGIVFHSFRYTAITYLFNQGIEEGLIGSLVGHATGTMTTGKVYMSGWNDSKRMDAISRLDELLVLR